METKRSKSDTHIYSNFPNVRVSMTCHPLVSRATWFYSSTQDVVSHRGAKDNCKDQVCIVRHEHKHQKERQAHTRSIQYSAQRTIERGHSESLLPRYPQPIQQARLLSIITMTFRRAPTTRSKRRPTSARFYSDTLIEVLRENSKVFIEHA